MFRTLGFLSTLGMTMAFSIGLGALAGYYLDKNFESAPCFFIIFLILGIIGGLWLAAKAFRVFLLMYGKTPKLGEIIRLLSQA